MGSGGTKAHETITISPAPVTIDQTEDLLAVWETAKTDDPATVSEWLKGLSDEELQTLAAQEGFAHPTLVGIHSPTNPLIHWLDPAYPDDLDSKAKIQAKALERYDALVEGEAIDGKTLTDLVTDEDALPTSDTTAAADEVTPSEALAAINAVEEARQAYDQIIADSYYNMNSTEEQLAALGDLIGHENHLQQISCPELADVLETSKQLTAAAVSDVKLPYHGDVPWPQLGESSDAERKWLSLSEYVECVRLATPAAQRQTLSSLAQQRAEMATTLNGLLEKGAGNLVGVLGAEKNQKISAITKWVENTHELASTWEEATGASPWLKTQYKKELGSVTIAHPTDFRSWAKKQKLQVLRAAASDFGLKKAMATRADVQNYLIAHYTASEDDKKNLDKFKPAANPTTAPKPAGKPPAANPSTPHQPAGPKKGRFGATITNITAKLKAFQGLAADLPKRTPHTEVASFGWGNGSNWSKGSHQSFVYEGPSAQKWMFKPDKSHAGARAEAEAAASRVFQKVGVPGVDVHTVTIDGKHGSIQPLVAGAEKFDATPTSWTQTDVDAMVQLHVAAWAVGDHDGHSNNILRVPSGAMFPVDQGQAFKFYGKDKLSPGWHPSSNHGTPVYHSAYSAHQGGHLGKDVTVRAKAALPVIKAFEAITDADYRQILKPVAESGVGRDVKWVPHMRKQAQTRLGKTSVSEVEIVDEFLSTAVERKRSLRSSFAKFFESVGVSDSGHLTLVA